MGAAAVQGLQPQGAFSSRMFCWGVPALRLVGAKVLCQMIFDLPH